MYTETGWEIIYDELNPEQLNHEETVLMTGNGYLSTRGSLPVRYHGENIATFVHGLYDDIAVSFTELVNIPNWTSFQIQIDGEKLDLQSGELVAVKHVLDMKLGTLYLDFVWKNSKGQETRFHFERFASLAEIHLLCQRLEITPLNYSAEVEVIVSLDGKTDNLGFQHWEFLSQEYNKEILSIELKTKKTAITLAMSQSLRTTGLTPSLTEYWNLEQHPSKRLVFNGKVGEKISIDKLTTVYTSRDLSNPVQAAKELLLKNKQTQWEKLSEQNEKAWKKEWAISDVIIKSKDDAQLMVRFSIYQMLICAPRQDDQVSIGAKTLSGYGYRGHVFWDTEIFLLPFFILTNPKVAKNLLSYRWHRLEGARAKAKKGGFKGAQFPWESALTGEEVTPTWVTHYKDPSKLVRIWTGDIQIHITADIAYAFIQYWEMTGDDEFMLDCGIPLILETAQFWSSRLEWEPGKGKYVITDVIGPDENHEHVNNNAFTNYSAKWHLRMASELYHWLKKNHIVRASQITAQIDLTKEDADRWESMSKNIYLPELTEGGVIEQFEGYFNLVDINLDEYKDRTQSMQEIFGIEESNQTQVLKQPDVVTMLYLFRKEFAKDVIEANYEYYNRRTDHEYGSSLGPSMQSLVASMTGRKGEAYEHFLRSAKADLYDIRGNVKDGIHAASLGGIWQAVVFGFSGLRFEDGILSTSPILPEPWEYLAFHINYKGKTHFIELRQKN